MKSALILDDHFLVRLGFKQVFLDEYRDAIVVEAKGPDEALARIQSRPWDLIALGINLPAKNGFDVLLAIRQSGCKIPVLVLSVHGEQHYVERTCQLGASGYLCKTAHRSDLVRALKTVMTGKKFFDAAVLRAAGEGTPLSPHSRLSPQEFKIMLALADGRRPIEIAADLQLSIQTVSTFKRRVLNKLGMKSLPDLVRYVMDQHLSADQSSLLTRGSAL